MGLKLRVKTATLFAFVSILLHLGALSEVLAGSFPQSRRDISPVPNYQGHFISLGMNGAWRQSKASRAMSSKRVDSRRFVGAAATGLGGGLSGKSGAHRRQKTVGTPRASCSPEAIVYYADRAPINFKAEKRGLLYGVKTHTAATRVADMPGYNSCALVVYAILKKAGCRWARYTANAKAIYDMAYKQGWRPSNVQKPGCLVAWNSKQYGNRARIGRGVHRKKDARKGVYYRHVGISTGSWMAMDNSSYFSRPSAFVTTRPIRYEPPIFLCPVAKKKR
ncbi:MAG: hypothetical protein AAF228_09830 [Pseudomonadota bacterium]